jgi:hypothetical protein
MRILYYLIATMIVCIIPCQADAVEQLGLLSTKGFTAIASETDSIPAWAINTPDAFVGISTPCSSIEEARQQALDSAIGQILQSMGAEYQLSHESLLTGDMNQSRYELKERLSYTARWLLNSVQQNIKQYAFQNAGNGYVCFVLVQMKPSELEKLKRLTIGAQLTARVVGTDGGRVSIEASESNGVGVTLNEYRLTLAVTHTNARLITLFFWKVPQADIKSIDGALAKRISLNNSSGNAVIPVSNGMNGLRSFIMGSKQDVSITLTGYDEIGRPVSLPVRLQ